VRSAPPRVIVTAYDRPDGLARLVDDLAREGLTGPQTHIYDDASPQRDAALERRIADLGCVLHRAERHHGKQQWWQWWNTILADLAATTDPDQPILVLQDDIRLCQDFWPQASALFDHVDDPARASLHLHVTAERSSLGSTCWTPVRAAPRGDVTHTGWVDMGAFVAHRRLFEALAWRLDQPAAQRWSGRDVLGSGVGEQISLRAHAAGLGMYQVRRSMVVHDDSASLMNPAARDRWPLRTIHFIDGDAAAARLASHRPAVLASLATVPSRVDALRHVVERLRPQVDRLLVYLNGHPEPPAFLAETGAEVVTSGQYGDRGDAGKFFPAGGHVGVHVVCDDDLDYPPDYVERLLDGLARYDRRAVVGYHASMLREPFTDYHRSRSITHMSLNVPRDVAVHVLGTGTLAFHSSTLAVRPEDFPTPNMADVWFALLGQTQQVPFVQLRREAGWLRELGQIDEKFGAIMRNGIYATARRADTAGERTPETAAVLTLTPWRVFPLPSTGPSRRASSASSAGVEATARAGARAGAAAAHHVERPPAPLVRVPVRGPTRSAVVVLPLHDHITVAVQRSGTYYERDLLDAVRATGAHGTYVDVGAHHGNHTAFFALECEATRVVAVEPATDAVAGLRETLAENGIGHRVDVRQVAVHPVWVRVKPIPVRWRPRWSTGAITNTGGRSFGADEAGAVAALPLDTVLAEVTGVAVVKVDAGGLSGEILESGRRTLARDRPLVAAAAGTDAEDAAVRMVLEPLGYRPVGRFGWSATWLWSPAGGGA